MPNVLCSKFFEYFQDFERNGANAQDEDGEENLLHYLTNREEEVLSLLLEGATYKAVLYAINKGFKPKAKKIAV